MATNETAPTSTATCKYCKGDYSAERAEIGYPYCMKPECTKQGRADKNAAPVELEVLQPETRF